MSSPHSSSGSPTRGTPYGEEEEQHPRSIAPPTETQAPAHQREEEPPTVFVVGSSPGSSGSTAGLEDEEMRERKKEGEDELSSCDSSSDEDRGLARSRLGVRQLQFSKRPGGNRRRSSTVTLPPEEPEEQEHRRMSTTVPPIGLRRGSAGSQSPNDGVGGGGLLGGMLKLPSHHSVRDLVRKKSERIQRLFMTSGKQKDAAPIWTLESHVGKTVSRHGLDKTDIGTYSAAEVFAIEHQRLLLLIALISCLAECAALVLYGLAQNELEPGDTVSWSTHDRPSYIFVGKTCLAVYFFVTWVFETVATRRILSVTTLLTLLTAVFQIIVALMAVSDSDMTSFYVPNFLRVWFLRRWLLRAIQIMIGLQAKGKIGSKMPIVREFFVHVTLMMSLMTTCAGVYRIIEVFGGEVETLSSCFYLMAVTFTTVGYGDIYPDTKLGQLAIILIIFLATAYLPTFLAQLAMLSEILSRQNGYKGHNKHVVIAGSPTHKEIVSILKEIASLSRNRVTVFLSTTPYEPHTVRLMLSPEYRHRVVLLNGNPCERKDLRRAGAERAEAIFFLTDKRARYHRGDIGVLKHSIYVQHFEKRLPQYLWMRGDRHTFLLKNVFASVHHSRLVKLIGALAMSYPHIVPILVNLIRHSPPATLPDDLFTSLRYEQDWRKLYSYSRTQLLRELPVKGSLLNMHFRHAALMLQKFYCMMPLAVCRKAEVLINPTEECILRDGDTLMVICATNLKETKKRLKEDEKFQKKEEDDDAGLGGTVRVMETPRRVTFQRENNSTTAPSSQQQQPQGSGPSPPQSSPETGLTPGERSRPSSALPQKRAHSDTFEEALRKESQRDNNLLGVPFRRQRRSSVTYGTQKNEDFQNVVLHFPSPDPEQRSRRFPASATLEELSTISGSHAAALTELTEKQAGWCSPLQPQLEYDVKAVFEKSQLRSLRLDRSMFSFEAGGENGTGTGGVGSDSDDTVSITPTPREPIRTEEVEEGKGTLHHISSTQVANAGSPFGRKGAAGGGRDSEGTRGPQRRESVVMTMASRGRSDEGGDGGRRLTEAALKDLSNTVPRGSRRIVFVHETTSFGEHRPSDEEREDFEHRRTHQVSMMIAMCRYSSPIISPETEESEGADDTAEGISGGGGTFAGIPLARKNQQFTPRGVSKTRSAREAAVLLLQTRDAAAVALSTPSTSTMGSRQGTLNFGVTVTNASPVPLLPIVSPVVAGSPGAVGTVGFARNQDRYDVLSRRVPAIESLNAWTAAGGGKPSRHFHHSGLRSEGLTASAIHKATGIHVSCPSDGDRRFRDAPLISINSRVNTYSIDKDMDDAPPMVVELFSFSGCSHLLPRHRDSEWLKLGEDDFQATLPFMTGTVISNDMFMPLLFQTFHSRHLTRFWDILLHTATTLNAEAFLAAFHQQEADARYWLAERVLQRENEKQAKAERKKQAKAAAKNKKEGTANESEETEPESATIVPSIAITSPERKMTPPPQLQMPTSPDPRLSGSIGDNSSFLQVPSFSKATEPYSPGRSPLLPKPDLPLPPEAAIPFAVRVGAISNEGPKFFTYRDASKALLLQGKVIPIAVVRYMPKSDTSSALSRYPITNPEPSFPLLTDDLIYFIR